MLQRLYIVLSTFYMLEMKKKRSKQLFTEKRRKGLETDKLNF